MESRLHVAGHSIHPVIVMFPLGLFAMAVIFDVAHVLGGPVIMSEVAYWNIAAGLVAGVLAALGDSFDLRLLRDGSPAKRAGVVHVLLNLGVIFLFAVVLMVRMGSGEHAAGVGLMVVELVALMGAGAGAWLGTRLAVHLPLPGFLQTVVGHHAR